MTVDTLNLTDGAPPSRSPAPMATPSQPRPPSTTFNHLDSWIHSEKPELNTEKTKEEEGEDEEEDKEEEPAGG